MPSFQEVEAPLEQLRPPSQALRLSRAREVPGLASLQPGQPPPLGTGGAERLPQGEFPRARDLESFVPLPQRLIAWEWAARVWPAGSASRRGRCPDLPAEAAAAGTARRAGPPQDSPLGIQQREVPSGPKELDYELALLVTIAEPQQGDPLAVHQLEPAEARGELLSKEPLEGERGLRVLWLALDGVDSAEVSSDTQKQPPGASWHAQPEDDTIRSRHPNILESPSHQGVADERRFGDELWSGERHAGSVGDPRKPFPRALPTSCAVPLWYAPLLEIR